MATPQSGVPVSQQTASQNSSNIPTLATVNVTKSAAQASSQTIKIPIATETIPNPMHQYASWSYSCSLWWLSIDDYNRLSRAIDAGQAHSMQLSSKSFVIAEDSGLYPDKRLVNFNYQIQDFNFDTTVGLNTSSKNSNAVSGSITIVEPYGVTFIDVLAEASILGSGIYYNYLENPFMLEINFTGFDDSGNPVPANETFLYRKRLPIMFTQMTMDASSSGATYNINFVPVNQFGYYPELSKLPKLVSISGTTVVDVLNDLTSKLNAYWLSEVGSSATQGSKGRIFADSISFSIDPAIAISEIVYTNEMSLSEVDANSVTINPNKTSFNIRAGTPLTDVVTRIISQSKYIANQLSNNLKNQGLTPATASPSVKQDNLTQIFNSFKLTVAAEYIGSNGNGNVDQAYDYSLNRYPRHYTYRIHQYSHAEMHHPAMISMPDIRSYVLKKYDYLYTGKNNDIIDFQLNFDMTYYTPAMQYNYKYPATQVTPSTSVNIFASQALRNQIFSPQFLAIAKANAAWNQVKTVQPLKTNIVNVDMPITQGTDVIKNAITVQNLDVMRSTYYDISADMISVELTIIGDPILIMQDDWLYTPDPNSSTVYNSWDSLSQSDYALKYGEIRFNSSELIVQLNINNAFDLDTDISNRGLMFAGASNNKSLFSGLYRIITVSNFFERGTFKQKLTLSRLFFGDYVLASTPSASTSSTRIPTQINLNSVNSTVINTGSTNSQATQPSITPGRN